MSTLIARGQAVVSEVVQVWLNASFEHEDWCCAKGCPGPGFCHGCDGAESDCRCLKAAVRAALSSLPAEVSAALVQHLGLREVEGFAVDFGRIEPVAHFQDGRPMAKVTHSRLVSPWHSTTEEALA